MPELPDIVVYIEALKSRVLDQPIEKIDIRNPFVLRTFSPPVATVQGRRVVELRRLGKRIILGLDGDLFIVIHLMIAGRLRWRSPGTKPVGGKLTQAGFHFPMGVLFLTEAGSKHRASIHLVEGESNLQQFDRGGLEVLEATLAEFTTRLRAENHTLKSALTDPRLFSGIGNSYSDEILHRARLSPLMLTSRIADDEIARLFDATRDTFTDWTDRLRAICGSEFPEEVTAFREGMAVHGRFGLPCPVCGTAVQRIRYADNETNYCARCQTGGKLLADRALSRLLKSDWPKTVEELEG
ncbi:MAG: formamidopyrimidine-DNA glycosylase [candidate division Zixibacteria bacterium]|nr:formamidopyrimidine-DNA glycosylase [candidate division Zixibacteria bacterium]